MNSADEKQDRVMKAALDCRTEMIAYARSLLGSYAAADDVLQESLLVVFKKYDQFKEGTSMLAWCRSIVRIEVLRAKQRRRREISLAERLLDDAVEAAFQEFQVQRQTVDEESRREALRQCLGKVPERGQSVLHARFADELSYQQIGERLEMTLEAVRKSLFRHKKNVRTCVENSLRAMQ